VSGHGVGAVAARQIADLPMRDGFRFVGLRHDGSRVRCVVKHMAGCGYYIRQRGLYCYDDVSDKLAGWVALSRGGPQL
jgi:hypothetical protein